MSKMSEDQTEAEECPVARTLEILGDRWSLMIIRDAFDGIRRFGEFRNNLGLAKNILAGRLRDLVEHGILRVAPASDGSAYHEYVLTEKGHQLFPIIVSLRQWGEEHLFSAGEKHSILVDNLSGQPISKLAVSSQQGQVLDASDCHREKVIKR
ncbi:winged helix-turn-helix transcriptional regulator [Yersinia enterocolitica]|uniref:Helix-turn-helix domain-containing protein n=1 Tax=Yersinia proxima TaxID=2890316 RepID=A0ABW9EYY4_9GAMM|nr:MULTISPECIES: helix-turn-helix domain-containing protein [Yersinia]CNL29710.1 putative transcriptional regulator [Yersinia intermedia]EKN3443685.1 helix-turn-helix transcriptional regulator [Yersinia enterocolitica]EKN3754821.1 helix-turn-helix transcriptional regulator [Yersinia enterocolitica]EKN3795565.1 helix-turn-helix transcriptional regulator [Yersinia enterocolitica]EKN3876728.1 helix-turn-helix transcriptional regulator [Yersinia enterocolitica]